ncbi:VOC family protein [Actinoplanes sp. NPDC049599]|uniref:VOC family protein n=1 Tax=Actinoplanes sp. NPDC049599 TaxID=3363903 RepID=UPI00379DBE05
MGVRWTTGFLDSPSRVAEPFWQAVTGSGLSPRRGPGGAFATLLPAGGDAYLRVQVVADGPARAHLDLHVEQVPAQARRAVGLGAAVVADEGELVVLRSPAGLLFCLVAWAGEAVRPVGGRSLVDQMCLDVPRAGFDVEADFWAALTGWQRRAGSLPEFDVLVRPPAMPLRLLLQRVDGPAGMHLDLACGDRAAEVAGHVALGAEVVAVRERWTTLRDPAGRAYCVTDRPV